MSVLSNLCSPIKNNQIPIIIAATVIIIVITISFLLMNLDKVDLLSFVGNGHSLYCRKKFLLTLQVSSTCLGIKPISMSNKIGRFTMRLVIIALMLFRRSYSHSLLFFFPFPYNIDYM